MTMNDARSMSRHVLYCNDKVDILVLDLPASIARAQESVLHLYSTSPPKIPYNTPEPKGLKRDRLLSTIPASERNYHDEIQNHVRNALSFLHSQWHEPCWCLPRATINEGRISDEAGCLNHQVEGPVDTWSPPLVLSPDVNNICCSNVLFGTVVHNSCSQPVTLDVATQSRFIVPGQSTFIQASIKSGLKAFENAVKCLLPRGVFDLILLDPPWTNRSVRNSRVYQSAEHQKSDVFGETFPTVSTFLGEDAYVAVWTTNKDAIRSQVLEVCTRYGLLLVEEWVWLKVTTNGEPVTPLDGVWRKPYETLLLFRRNAQKRKVLRRISIAVPDVHSRKPSLKYIFEQILPEKYNALELFARNLTSGWWSWGDEVLKFQHEDHWH